MDWEALGKAVLARRVELGHESQGSFAEAADIAARTIGDIERGKRTSYRPSILARLERALRWPLGTVEAILTGQSVPTSSPAPEPQDRTPTPFGLYLLRAIHDAGYASPRAFAEAAGLNPALVVRWIYGRAEPSLELLSQAAPPLNIPADDLIAHAGDDALAAGGMPIPVPIAVLLDRFYALNEANRKDLLDRVEWVNEWAGDRARKQDLPP